MSDGHQTAQVLREQAARCRRLANAICDTEVERRLLELASEFDARAVSEEEGERTRPENTARP
jgi:hypothetical protein